MVAAEDGLEVVVFEEIKELRCIGGAVGHAGPEGEVGEEGDGAFLVEAMEGVVEEGEGAMGDGDLGLGAVAGVEADKLPASVVEDVVEGIGKDVHERGAIVVADVIVVATDDADGNAEGFEEIADGRELSGRAVVGEVAGEEAEVGFLLGGFHLGDDFLEELAAGLADVMQIVEDEEMEIQRLALAGEEGYGADGGGEERSGGGAEKLATRERPDLEHGGSISGWGGTA